MRPILRRLHSPDLADMLNNAPANSESFSILVQAMIGPSDGSGEESFDLVVCTPDFIAAQVEKDGFVFGKDYLIVLSYNYHRIFDLIDSVCDGISGANWQDVARKIGRYGKWEFEDYVE